MVVTDAAGAEVYRTQLRQPDHQRVFKHTLPALRGGHYRVHVSGPNKLCRFRYLKVAPAGTQRVVECGPALGIHLGFGRWFSRPKAGASEMTFDLRQRWGSGDRCRSVGVIYDPDGRRVARFDMPVSGREQLTLTVRPEHRGKLFKIHTRGVVVWRTGGIKPYFAQAPEEFFLPKHPPP